MAQIKRAIISVSDKSGIVDFSKELSLLGVELISTGGTYKLLKENGVKVQEVSEITGFPEMLDGRVKTLHPKIHAGILARRDLPAHMESIKEKGIEPIDMVVVNLYPFKQTVLKEGSTIEEIVENIDIGGPSMIRAAAKNYRSVAVLTDPDQYPAVLEQLKINKELDQPLLEKLMAEAFITTANYDAMIAGQMYKKFCTGFPKSFPIASEKVEDLRYGENPNQKAAFYKDPFTPGTSVAKAEQLHGKQLSYNNILDLDKSLDIAMDFEKPTAVVMKHTNPCGLASADTIFEAFKTSYAVDPLSAFGCVICLNRNCDIPTAEEIAKYFVEAVICPDFEPGVVDLLEKKKNIRLLRTKTPISPAQRYREFKMKKVQGGLLVQTDDDVPIDPKNLKVITKRAPTEEEIAALLFAWKLAKHVTSNAVVFVKGERAVGIGAGQMSRVDSAKIAAMKANEPTAGSVMASDAFFPFRDGVDTAAAAGVTAIIQPGGSIRDQEVIDAANEHNMAMVFTGCRVFRH
ncbi:MAG: bifunctional phosphoribosylaminoimidazolecarboxamide formyltransferase/IMP cyclohydrolase [Candidatus Methanomethylophilaceae archaeon]|nr:bifunctional phosphoribosylaminoimidazolecarboxamide formyltransferase/IMP cyclohydrolase [Candidatus Methanomethylophilaceae archaeon]MDD3378907.1 bifunctional phosphoribosylaminoimidazolecarboxamide formyltransferase/IMP cyclohydrolase [Candidatus Methanomethylophilaceae archaeon]MDY0223896.1 bifunctional phosphoribosylaminoimidazolecarboxamide formyltransferase/IMP cyclohydrolase [Candidatus Methanomethylophilaceae archaeon]